MTEDSQLVQNMETVWRSIDGLCTGLTEAQWKTPTDCPGWSVQDQISHLTGAEAALLGRPKPDHTPADTSFVRNEIGQNNEVLVDWRRRLAGNQVLEEFREMTARRLEVLKALTPPDFDQDTETPIGPGKVRDYIAIRVYDAWVHEQDIRRALGIPGHLDGPVARHGVGRTYMAMPYVVGRKARAPDGVTVLFQVTGPAGWNMSVGVEGGRAKEIDPPVEHSAILTMDVETFTCLGCGRWTAEQAVSADKVQISGDRSLGETIIAQMNFMV